MNDAQLPVQTDKPQPEWEKLLNKLVKRDLQRQGVMIVTWGEEDYAPRTEIEEELRVLITDLLSQLLQECKERIEKQKNKRKSTHGSCCTCQLCGYSIADGDECECDRNSVLETAKSIISDIQKEHGL